MQPVSFALLLALGAASTLLAAPSPKPIYAFALLGNDNEDVFFGTFDLGNPTGGSLGSYTYAWTNLESPFYAGNGLTMQPGTNTLFYVHSYTDLQTISTSGTVTGNRGPITYEGANFIDGMAFLADGTLKAVNMTAEELVTLNPTDGTLVGAPASLGLPNAYLSFSTGNLAAVGNDLYLANYALAAGSGTTTGLYRLGATTTLVGEFIGTDFDPAGEMSLFAYDASLYLLNSNRVYGVSTANGNLTLLGTVTGLDPDFYSFTAAAGNIAGTPIPEPSTYGLLLGAGALAIAAVRRRRRSA